MPAESLNCPPRSNVSTAKDNNNIHRSPSVVNRSAQHRPHRTKFGRRLSAKSTTSRRKDTIISSPRPLAHMPDRHSLCTPDTALAKHKDRSARVQVRKNCFLIYCAGIGLARVLPRFGVERKRAAAAVRRVMDECGGGRAAGAREGREVRVTILKCGNFDKTSLQKFSF